MKSVQIQSYFWSVFSCIRTEYGDLPLLSLNIGKHGPEITPYLDTFHVVFFIQDFKSFQVCNVYSRGRFNIIVYQVGEENKFVLTSCAKQYTNKFV